MAPISTSMLLGKVRMRCLCSMCVFSNKSSICYLEQKQLEGLMEKLQAAGLEDKSPYPPERGDVVAVRFSDGQWYRARVLSIKSNNVNVFYADYGNVLLPYARIMQTLLTL